MNKLSDEQLNAQIKSFIDRKHQQYPELALRGREKRAESIGYVLADRITAFVSNARLARLAH